MWRFLCEIVHLDSRFLQNIPVNGAVLVVAEQLLRSRKFSLTHGGILDTRDIVGIRKGESLVEYWVTFSNNC